MRTSLASLLSLQHANQLSALFHWPPINREPSCSSTQQTNWLKVALKEFIEHFEWLEN